MSRININTASKEELMKLKDIADKRASAIIEARKKAPLTLETIKLVPGLPQSIWDPLFQAKKIIFQEDDTEEESEKILKLQQLVNKFKTETLILKQAEVTLAKEKEQVQTVYEGQLNELQTELETLRKQNDILQKEMKERQDKFEDYANQVNDQKEAELQQLKLEIKQRREEYEDKKEIQEQEISLAKKELCRFQDEREQLLSNIGEQGQIVDSIYKDAKVKDDRLKEQGVKLNNLEKELQLLKFTEEVDALAPHHVYSSTKASPTSIGKKQDTEVKTSKSNYVQQPQFPKLSTYDGINDWKPYQLQFEHTATRFEWNEHQKLDNFLLCLRGKALKFFSTRPHSVQKDFDQLMEKMNQRFGKKDLPHSIRRQLQDVKQNMDESIEEFAERVQELATDGYIDATEDIIELMAVDAFLQGCSGKKAALSAMDKNPNRIDLALQYVKSSIHNQRVLLGYKKPAEVRKVQFEDQVHEDTDSDGDTFNTIRVMNKKPFKPNWQQTMETRMEKTEKEVTGIKDNVAKILNILSSKQNDRKRSRSPSPNRSRSPMREVTCYACNDKGHYSNQCPKKRSLSPSSKPLNI